MLQGQNDQLLRRQKPPHFFFDSEAGVFFSSVAGAVHFCSFLVGCQDVVLLGGRLGADEQGFNSPSSPQMLLMEVSSLDITPRSCVDSQPPWKVIQR